LLKGIAISLLFHDARRSSSSIEAVGCLQVLMVEPVIAADGHTYEKAAIETWLQQHTVSPVTGDFLAHTRIVPNVLIKSAIGTNQGL